MKKLTYILSALALSSAMFASCNKDSGGNNLDNVIEDGFYVAGAATGSDKLDAVYMMATGVNEAVEGKPKRDGMFEKYVVLDANKEFELLLYEAGKKTRYSATLAAFSPNFDMEIYADNPDMEIYKGKLVTGTSAPAMKVTERGLYHIVLDLNKQGDLKDGAQIIIAPVKWGVRGAMNGWGYTEMTATEADGAITYTIKDCDMPAKGEFKFGYGGWKITLDDAGKVKAETSLGISNDGKGLVVGGGNIAVGDKAGLYDITFTFRLAGGELGNSFKYETKLTKESTLPTEMYFTGTDFGNWTWGDPAVVKMIPVHSEGGKFWAIRYLTANKGIKFNPVNVKDDWSKAFAKLTANEGFINDKDGNLVVEQDGIYCIGVDMKNSRIVVEKAPVFGIGDAFGGWTVKSFPYTAEGQVMTINTTAAGKLRTYVNTAILDSENDWWHAEFVLNNGVIEYRGGGNDPAEVLVTAGQTITLDFNAGTGTIR